MYSTPTVSLPVTITLVASPCPARIRTSGTQITLRSSRSATLFCGRVVSSDPSGSKFIDSSSLRCSSARRITSRGTRRSVSRKFCPRRFRATRVSSAAPAPPPRNSRNPRSAPVIVSAVSTTLASTSSIENELCKVRARSRMARSFARLPPTPSGAAAGSPPPTCSISRFSSTPSSANSS